MNSFNKNNFFWKNFENFFLQFFCFITYLTLENIFLVHNYRLDYDGAFYT